MRLAKQRSNFRKKMLNSKQQSWLSRLWCRYCGATPKTEPSKSNTISGSQWSD